jgi:hypothetical protein
LIFDEYRVYSGELFALRPEFVESTAPDSMFIFSVVPEMVTRFGARVVDSEVIVETDAGCYCRVIVAGVHKHFPLWDMKEVSDEAAAKSRKFFNQEWK